MKKYFKPAPWRVPLFQPKLRHTFLLNGALGKNPIAAGLAVAGDPPEPPEPGPVCDQQQTVEHTELIGGTFLNNVIYFGGGFSEINPSSDPNVELVALSIAGIRTSASRPPDSLNSDYMRLAHSDYTMWPVYFCPENTIYSGSFYDADNFDSELQGVNVFTRYNLIAANNRIEVEIDVVSITGGVLTDVRVSWGHSIYVGGAGTNVTNTKGYTGIPASRLVQTKDNVNGMISAIYIPPEFSNTTTRFADAHQEYKFFDPDFIFDNGDVVNTLSGIAAAINLGNLNAGQTKTAKFTILLGDNEATMYSGLS